MIEKIEDKSIYRRRIFVAVMVCGMMLFLGIVIAYLYYTNNLYLLFSAVPDKEDPRKTFLFMILCIVILTFLFILAYKQLIENAIKLQTKYKGTVSELQETEELLKQKNEELEETMNSLTESERRYKIIFEASDEGLWFMDIANKQTVFSKRWFEIFGFDYKDEGLSIEKCLERVHPDDYALFKTLIQDIQKGTLDRFAIEIKIMDASGTFMWMSAKAIGLKDESQNIKLMAGSYRNINESKIQEQKFIKIAYYDNLTLLPNRVFIYEWLNKRIEMNLPNGFTVIFLDIDNFKIINDNFGHSLGDKVITEVGERLNQPSETSKMVARMSGDEFLIILDQVVELAKINEIGRGILEVFKQPIRVENNELHISASIGAATFPKDANSIDELLKNADTALSRAKDLGKNCLMVFDKSMNDEVRLKVEMGNSLRYAIENDELSVYYQPQVSVSTGKIYGFEALIRWNSAKYGFVSPAKFIKIAEELGFIVSIGDWVFKHSCIFAERVNKNRKDKFIISINISSIQLMQSDFVEKIEKSLEETKASPEYIGIEITETALMESFDTSALKLEKLKEKGMEIALDDFGTGYSSLNYLRKLPITKLKIDKSFVDDLMFDEKGANLAESIIQIAHKFGMDVVAEGVENEEQLAILISSDCDIIQGFLISRPLPEFQLEDIMDLEYHFELISE